MSPTSKFSLIIDLKEIDNMGESSKRMSDLLTVIDNQRAQVLLLQNQVKDQASLINNCLKQINHASESMLQAEQKLTAATNKLVDVLEHQNVKITALDQISARMSALSKK